MAVTTESSAAAGVVRPFTAAFPHRFWKNSAHVDPSTMRTQSLLAEHVWSKSVAWITGTATGAALQPVSARTHPRIES